MNKDTKKNKLSYKKEIYENLIEIQWIIADMQKGRIINCCDIHSLINDSIEKLDQI